MYKQRKKNGQVPNWEELEEEAAAVLNCQIQKRNEGKSMNEDIMKNRSKVKRQPLSENMFNKRHRNDFVQIDGN